MKRVAVIVVLLVGLGITCGRIDVASAAGPTTTRSACDKWDSECHAPWYCLTSDRLDADCRPADVAPALFYAPWVRWSTLAAGVLFLLTLGAAAFPAYRIDREDPQKATSGTHDFSLYASSGTVVGIDHAVMTEAGVDDAGWWSRTTSRRVARLADGDVINVGPFPIGVGQQLHSVWAREDGCVYGPQALRNPATGQSCVYPARMKRHARFSRVPLLFLSVSQAIAFRQLAIVSVPVVAVVYLVLSAPFTSVRLGRMRRHVASTFPSGLVP